MHWPGPQQSQGSSSCRNQTKSPLPYSNPPGVSHCTRGTSKVLPRAREVLRDLVPASSHHFISFSPPPGSLCSSHPGLRSIHPLLCTPDSGPWHGLVPCPEFCCPRYWHGCLLIINISTQTPPPHRDLVLPLNGRWVPFTLSQHPILMTSKAFRATPPPCLFIVV